MKGVGAIVCLLVLGACGRPGEPARPPPCAACELDGGVQANSDAGQTSTDGGPAGVDLPPADGGPADAGGIQPGDGGGSDGGADAGPPDSGSSDAGSSDAGSPDAGPSDAGPADGGAADAGAFLPLRESPVLKENLLEGGRGWHPHRCATSLAGFLDRTSYLPGETVRVHAGAAAPTSVSWELWRVGHYGGSGGRKLLSGGPTVLPTWSAAVMDAKTGAVSAPWPTAFSFDVPASALTGAYVVKISSATETTFATLVVREPVPAAPILYSVSTNTYQAYNAWGGTSLYVSRRADWSSAYHAYSVSFDRPYDQGCGTGELVSKDFDFITFAEGQGYDIAYVTDADLDEHPELAARRRMVVIQGHSEYWTAGMRNAVEAAIAAGTNAAFLSSNNAYWQVRFTDSGRRTLLGYKEYAALDPVAATDPRLLTTNWRDARVGRPENAMIGEMFGDWIWVAAPLTVADPTSWLWTGAGVEAGTFIPGVYGDESDHRFQNGAEPPGLVSVATGFVEGFGPRFGTADTTLYTAPSGAQVFSGGSIFWSRGLAGDRIWHPILQQAVANLFSRFAGDGTLGAAALRPLKLDTGQLPPVYRAGVKVTTVTRSLDRPAAIAVTSAGDAIIADGDRILRVLTSGSVSVVAGGAEGSSDGPAAQATFRAPRGLAVAKNGDIYVADSGNHRIRVISGGVVRTVAGGAVGFADGPGAQARFNQPMSLALTADGTLLIADALNSRLRAMDAAGNVGTWAGTGSNSVVGGPGATACLSLPMAVTLLPGGDALIAEASTGLVRKVAGSAGHEVTLLAGEIGRSGWNDGPVSTASISEIYSLAALADGQVVLVDGASARLRVLNGGTVETLAGGKRLGGADGDGASATFSAPRAAAVAPDGSILVVDAADHSLRRVVLGK